MSENERPDPDEPIDEQPPAQADGDGMSEPAPAEAPDAADAVDASDAEVTEEEVAFDINDFPGGARSAIEAVLMVVDQPVTEMELATALELPTDEVHAHIEALEAEYAQQQRGFTLRCINDGWRVYSRSDYAPVVEKFLMGGQQAKLTQASLETLAVIAYRQPISRSRVSAVRGVNVDGVVRTLLTRGLITEAGNDEDSTATLYCTTPYFLQRLGISSLDELPPLAPYLPDSDVIDELLEQGNA